MDLNKVPVAEGFNNSAATSEAESSFDLFARGFYANVDSQNRREARAGHLFARTFSRLLVAWLSN